MKQAHETKHPRPEILTQKNLLKKDLQNLLPPGRQEGAHSQSQENQEQDYFHALRYLASNVYDLRSRRGLSQEALAQLAGVPRPVISKIEGFKSNPSFETIVKIAAALQVSVEKLLRRPRRTSLLTPGEELHRYKSSDGHAVLTQLMVQKIPGMSFELIELKADGRYSRPELRPYSKELIYCIEGIMQVNQHPLYEGDVYAHSSERALFLMNLGKKKCRCISVVFYSTYL